MNFSVIVCARKEGDSAKLRDSFPPPEHGCIDLVEVVGAPGMSVGFNKGVKKAKHDILLFTHTDVHVWAGVQLLEEMLDVVAQPSVGFVGVAGSDSLRASCRWWESERKHGCDRPRRPDRPAPGPGDPARAHPRRRTVALRIRARPASWGRSRHIARSARDPARTWTRRDSPWSGRRHARAHAGRQRRVTGPAASGGIQHPGHPRTGRSQKGDFRHGGPACCRAGDA